MKKNFSILFFTLTFTTIILSSCGKGEDDPFFSIHTRDARMAQPWKLVEMNGTVVKNDATFTYEVIYDSLGTPIDTIAVPSEVATNIVYKYDGTNIFITTNDETESYGYTFLMDINTNGDVTSSEVFTNPANPSGVPPQSSSKTSYWFWGNDDKNKTSVNLDLTGIFKDYPTYDIPRLAWNDMTLSVSYSDNNQFIDSFGNVTSSTSTVLIELKFEIDLE